MLGRVTCSRLAVACAAAAAAGTGGPLSAQTLADLQPGRNFVSSAAFGTSYSEEVDPGDCDNDGDLDVIVANGGDGGNLQNRIYINLGGRQGGTTGAFVEETATRFLQLVPDSSRDIEFVDLENDGDLDIFSVNHQWQQQGQPSRFFTNLGGLQDGSVGYFTEETNERWGTLISVPPAQQVFGGNQGPFLGYSADCDFADLDDDGDTDIFFCNYGPNVDGTVPSRIFLNDGTGVFNEAWPWANVAADIQMHAIDADLVDLDGDFDLDVMVASRNSQARTFMNNLYGGISASLFNDITKTALIDTGATYSGNLTYETEYADVDADGDFDLWMVDYNGTTDRILRNNGFVAGVGYSFTTMQAWIKGDPNFDENEADFIDYDADGDLDMFLANFSGTNFLYQSGLAQGLAFDTVGLYHRTGTTSGGSLAPSPETPATDNGGTSLDADAADIDNDGDEDILVANDANQQNRLYANVLGVPDTHAPSFFKVTLVADKPNGTGTVIHAQVRDNSGFYLVTFYDARLIYAVDGGAPVDVALFSQGGQQFRGVIPAQVDAVIAYHVACTDLAGNIGVSATQCFRQGSPPTPWFDIGFGLAGAGGVPALSATGTLVAGSAGSLDLAAANPSSAALLFVSLVSAPAPFKGGTLAAFPPVLTLPLTTSVAGDVSLAWQSWPAGVPACSTLLFQYTVADGGAPKGVALSNALLGVTP